ncbi:ComF family protein [Uliginosibacterium sp. IMCC34675]|uniref:ComF family protein n=1 Tax=Uliginosibacterium aquaticum TaxID=2731212 RepID=A0ABX2IFB1_9RHOO|nr:ComF family protein [Uliginosibacterium aquaticum]
MGLTFVKTAGDDPGEVAGLSNRIIHAARYGSSVLRGLWPQTCFVCGERAGRQPLCPACAAQVRALPAPGCPCCALPMPVAGVLCGRCQRRPPHFDATHAPFIYSHPLREMVLALKHGQGFGLTGWMVQALAGAGRGVAADCLLPMPLHRRRLAERGFNQAMELARGLGRELGLPVRAQVLLRDVDTRQLAGLRQRERRRCVRGAFRCVADLSGLHVLVVDDVMTSGATLDEVARSLKQAGAARVTNLVLARTLRERPD